MKIMSISNFSKPDKKDISFVQNHSVSNRLNKDILDIKVSFSGNKNQNEKYKPAGLLNKLAQIGILSIALGSIIPEEASATSIHDRMEINRRLRDASMARKSSMMAFAKYWNSLSQYQQNLLEEIENQEYRCIYETGSTIKASKENFALVMNNTGATIEDAQFVIANLSRLEDSAMGYGSFEPSGLSPRKVDLNNRIKGIVNEYYQQQNIIILPNEENINKMGKDLRASQGELYYIAFCLKRAGNGVKLIDDTKKTINESDKLINETWNLIRQGY